MQFIKNNIAVIIAFALPLVLILGVASTVYLPGLFFKTNFNFVYIACDMQDQYYRYDCPNYLSSTYKVENGKLAISPLDPNLDRDKNSIPDVNEMNGIVRIFLHDNTTNTGREITKEEAQALLLSSLITAPDGVSIDSSYNHNGGFFPFYGGSSDYGHYISKGKSSKRLNLINENDRNYYSNNNFRFIGWVIGK